MDDEESNACSGCGEEDYCLCCEVCQNPPTDCTCLEDDRP